MQIQQSLAAQSLAIPALKPTSAEASGGGVQQLSTTTVAASDVSTENNIATPVDPQVLSQSVSKLNSMVQGLANGLQFSIDEESKTQVVKLVDLDTKEVIRQIPSEEAISIAQAIDRFQGLLVKDKA